MDTSGNETCATPESGSDAVAWSAKEPDPAGLNQSVAVPACQCWKPEPVTAVGAVAEIVGAEESVCTSASAVALDGDDWLSTRSEIR